MPEYAVWVHPAGEAPCRDRTFAGTKRDALRILRRVAATRYPGCTVRRSNDALVVRRDGVYVATVAVERVRPASGGGA